MAGQALIEPRRFLGALSTEVELLLDAARRMSPGAPVRTCPGFTVNEVVRHLGGVYRVTRGWILEGRAPRWYQRTPVPGQSTEDYLRAGLTELLAEFRTHHADTPAATWWPADPTYGFWYRRMAHETTIHRIDLQLAAADAGATRTGPFRHPGLHRADAGLAADPSAEEGGDSHASGESTGPTADSDADRSGDSAPPGGYPRAPGAGADQITPLAEDFATDGVDEALAVWFGQRLAMLGLSGTATKSVGVRTGGHHWIARAGPGFTEAWPCSALEAQRADALVSGSPMQVYLWMWGRRDHRAVTWTGDVDAAGQLWALMRLATR